MKGIYKILIIALILFSCDPDRKKKVDSENLTFDTTDSSELFFKNIRRPYYDLEEKKEAGLEIFRLQERLIDNKQAIINLSIIFNWRNDTAFIYIEPNNLFIDASEFTIYWKSKQDEEGIYQFTEGNRDTHFTFAAQLYNSILAEHQLFYKKNNVIFPLLDNELERDVFRVTMFDYLRLVNYF